VKPFPFPEHKVGRDFDRIRSREDDLEIAGNPVRAAPVLIGEGIPVRLRIAARHPIGMSFHFQYD
jgi:hypothetical protein